MNLKAEFDEAVWSRIIDMLADRPFKETGAIINTLAAQFAQQRDQAPEAKPPPPTKRNGADKHDTA